MRRAYADRSRYLGDPDFYPVPVELLVDKQYATKLRRGINLNQASLSTDIKPALSVPVESPQTTHFSVWDSQGNVVSNTYTLNFSYGSGIAVEGAGFLLNNEMDDFSAKPGTPNAYGLIGDEANAIAPYKRPLSSMTPTIVFKNQTQTKEPLLATGSPGGSTIITVVLQNILNYLEFDMNIAEATAAPRIHHQWLPDRLSIEPGISPDTIHILHGMGHNIAKKPRIMGRVQAIASGGDGVLSAATDSRWPGGAAIASER
jgi:gamma-glutamyltranspeptidase/glutathione hydrolase